MVDFRIRSEGLILSLNSSTQYTTRMVPGNDEELLHYFLLEHIISTISTQAKANNTYRKMYKMSQLGATLDVKHTRVITAKLI